VDKTGCKHFFVPDTQIQDGVPLDHLEAAMNYVVDHKPDTVVVIGDWWDMPSLSTYESRGSKYFEGRRYRTDIESGIEALDAFMRPLLMYNDNRRRNKMRQYRPRLIFTEGNHEHRINRAVNAEPKLEGVISTDDYIKELWWYGFEWYPFLEVVNVDGIRYSHYHVNPHSVMGSPISGSMDTMLKNVGYSFTQGHTQTLKYGVHYLSDGSVRQGLVAGAFYQHEEEYKGRQGNSHWRGCVMKNEVRDGRYDPCFLSLEYLLRKWK